MFQPSTDISEGIFFLLILSLYVQNQGKAKLGTYTTVAPRGLGAHLRHSDP